MTEFKMDFRGSDEYEAVRFGVPEPGELIVVNRGSILRAANHAHCYLIVRRKKPEPYTLEQLTKLRDGWWTSLADSGRTARITSFRGSMVAIDGSICNLRKFAERWRLESEAQSG